MLAGGFLSSDCQAADALARWATACSSLGSRAASGMRDLAANWVGSMRPPEGNRDDELSSWRELGGEWCCCSIHGWS